MTPREAGFLLLTSHLGDPDRKILTVAQFRKLSQRVKIMEKPDSQRQLEQKDLVALGYDRDNAQRILDLLHSEEQLHWYLSAGKKHRCFPLTRVTAGYPRCLRQRLGLDSPGCLWYQGDLSLLAKPAIALVGSRELNPKNLEFAAEVGYQAARQGYVLVSGNARGADRTAQEACLESGGKVICVVADALQDHDSREGVLYLSEDGFDLPFSNIRALSRNRIIHTLAEKTFVAQCTYGKGGTWDGTIRNLRHGWSPVFCYQDGTAAVNELTDLGAQEICLSDLADFKGLKPNMLNFIDQ